MDAQAELDRIEDRAEQEADAYRRWLATLPPLSDRSHLFPAKHKAVA